MSEFAFRAIEIVAKIFSSLFALLTVILSYREIKRTQRESQESQALCHYDQARSNAL